MSRLYLQHPEDDQLLAYADGELHGLAASRIRRHLKECWRCRTQLEDLQSTVTSFMRYKEQVLEDNLPLPPAEWKSLAQDFDRIDRTTPAPGIGRRLVQQFSGKPARIAMAAAVVCVAGFGALATYISWPRPQPSEMVRPEPVSEAVNAPASRTDREAPVAAPSATTKSAAPAVAATTTDVSFTGNAEVKVVAALHRIGADLGEPIEVGRDSAGNVMVTGVALAPGRREEVKSALAGVPGIRLRWEETTSPSGRTRQAAIIQAQRLPWQAELEIALGGRAQLEQFTNTALDLSDQISSRAYALRALESRFAGAALSAPERQEVNAIAAAHRRELKSAAVQLRALVTPALEKLGGNVTPATGSGRAPVLDAARKTDQSLNVLLAGAGNARTLDEILPELGKAIGQLMKVAEE